MFHVNEVQAIPPTRVKYPWDKLTEVGMSFVITADDKSGFNFARQLVYARNKTKISLSKGIKFRAYIDPKQLGNMVVMRIK
jgi:hypothetical protein